MERPDDLQPKAAEGEGVGGCVAKHREKFAIKIIMFLLKMWVGHGCPSLPYSYAYAT